MSIKIVCVNIQFGFVGMLAHDQGLSNVVKIHDWYEQLTLNDRESYMTQINAILKRMIGLAMAHHDKTESISKGLGHVLVQSVVVIDHVEN